MKIFKAHLGDWYSNSCCRKRKGNGASYCLCAVRSLDQTEAFCATTRSFWARDQRFAWRRSSWSETWWSEIIHHESLKRGSSGVHQPGNYWHGSAARYWRIHQHNDSQRVRREHQPRPRKWSRQAREREDRSSLDFGPFLLQQMKHLMKILWHLNHLINSRIKIKSFNTQSAQLVVVNSA